MLLWTTNQNRNLYITAVVSPSVLGSPTYYIAQCGPSTLSLPTSLSVHVARTCCQLSRRLHPLRESGWRLCFEIARFIPLGARSHQSLNSSKVVYCAPQQLSNQLVHLDHLWRSLTQLVQSLDWPIPVFKSAKRIAGRGQAGLLSSSSPAYPQNAHHNSLSVFAGRIGESRTLGSTPRISGHRN